MLDPDHDTIGPAGSELLAGIGLDPRAIRDALDDDRARRCPDREKVPPRRCSMRCARASDDRSELPAGSTGE